MNEKINLNSLIQFDALESSELGSSQGDSLEVNPAQGSIGQLISVYVIQNLYHQKYYVGETLNTRNRISEHWNSLIRNQSTIKELQNDFNDIKNQNIKPEDCIKFTLVFYKSFVFIDEQTLNSYNSEIRKLEAKLIKKGSAGKLKDEYKVYLYNSSNFNYEAKINESSNMTKVPSNYSPCLVFNKPYPSIGSAASFEKIDKQALARKIADPTNENFKSINREQYFNILGEQEKQFESFSDLNNESSNKITNVSKPKPKFTGLQYTDPFDKTIIITARSIRQFKEVMGEFLRGLSNEERQKRNNLGIYRTMIDDTDDINQCKYTRLLSDDEFTFIFPGQNKRSGISVSVNVDGITYSSLSAAATAYNVTRKTITTWCHKGVTSFGAPCKFV